MDTNTRELMKSEVKTFFAARFNMSTCPLAHLHLAITVANYSVQCPVATPCSCGHLALWPFVHSADWDCSIFHLFPLMAPSDAAGTSEIYSFAQFALAGTSGLNEWVWIRWCPSRREMQMPGVILFTGKIVHHSHHRRGLCSCFTQIVSTCAFLFGKNHHTNHLGEEPFVQKALDTRILYLGEVKFADAFFTWDKKCDTHTPFGPIDRCKITFEWLFNVNGVARSKSKEEGKKKKDGRWKGGWDAHWRSNRM